MTFLGFFLYSTMSSADSDSFTSSFPTWIPFIYFPYLITVSRTTNTMLNKGGQRRHPDLRGNIFRFPPLVEFLTLVLPTGLSYMDFIILRYVHSIPTLLRVFNHNCMLNFVQSFFCRYWDDHRAFTLQFVAVVVYHSDLCVCVDIENSLHPWDKSYLVMMYDIF